nr:hypothetical protein [Nocardia abscessus]
MQFIDRVRQRAGRVSGFADRTTEFGALGLPLLRGEQIRRRIGVAARTGHEHVPGAQPVTQAEQHAQRPIVPVGGGIAATAGLLEVAAPLGRHEPGRSLVEHLAAAGRVQLTQHGHRDQQIGRRGAAGEPDARQHVRGELAQIGNEVFRAVVFSAITTGTPRTCSRLPPPWKPTGPAAPYISVAGPGFAEW